jgi:hypothetical protein
VRSLVLSALVLAAAWGCHSTTPESGTPGGTSLAPRCIESGPRAAATAPRPSLKDVEPRVLWRTTLPWRGLKLEFALAGDRLAVVGGNKLWLLDLQGNIVGGVLDPESQVASAPVADAQGNFYFASSKVFSVARDGHIRWSLKLGSNLDASWETTYTSKLLLGPDETLYFAASDGLLYAIRSTDGQLVWKQQVGLAENGHVPWVGPGVGDTFFVGGVPYQASVGTASAQPQVRGDPVLASFPSFTGLVAGRFVDDGTRLQLRMHFLDRCGQTAWSLPETKSWRVDLAGFGDSLLAYSGEGASWYSPEGALQRGPRPLGGFTTALGADGTLYNTVCSQQDASSADMTLVASSLELTESWRIELGKPCTYSGTALADNGVLYLARELPAGIEVIAVQTASPGLAATAWPARWHDNRQTGWLHP